MNFHQFVIKREVIPGSRLPLLPSLSIASGPVIHTTTEQNNSDPNDDASQVDQSHVWLKHSSQPSKQTQTECAFNGPKEGFHDEKLKHQIILETRMPLIINAPG